MLVLIESDWNLKYPVLNLFSIVVSINRIRLEFKVSSAISIRRCTCVLIESDWNLKRVEMAVLAEIHERINRIRLEFKVSLTICETTSGRQY